MIHVFPRDIFTVHFQEHETLFRIVSTPFPTISSNGSTRNKMESIINKPMFFPVDMPLQNHFKVMIIEQLQNVSRIIHRTAPDRKSTRLNSSHVRISYAVFCLKKKIHALKIN